MEVYRFLSRPPQGTRLLDSELKYKIQGFLLVVESWNVSTRTEGLLGVVVSLDVQTQIHVTHVTTGPSGDS